MRAIHLMWIPAGIHRSSHRSHRCVRIGDNQVERVAEHRRIAHPGGCFHDLERLAERARLYHQNLALDRVELELGGSPERDQPAAKDQRKPIAVFRLVHVVGRNENRDTLGAQLLNEFPEPPARDRVNTRSRLVQKNNRRPMQHGASKREPLLPSAGERNGKIVFAPTQSRHSERPADSIVQLVANDIV